jgi:hypothetical protein
VPGILPYDPAFEKDLPGEKRNSTEDEDPVNDQQLETEDPGMDGDDAGVIDTGD